ncbi:MAG TPA: dihydrolipoamide acetyltransferase family protein, partial [Acidimicrobiia bacterium]
AATTAEPRRVKASPMARRLAAEHGVDLTGLVGSGIDGLVVSRDMGTLVPRSGTAPAGAIEPEGRAETMRRAIARSMSHSKREIPHYYLGNHVDLSKALTWLDARNEERSITERVLPAALLLKATALALKETPDLNGHWVDDGFRPSEAIHLGVAVSLREGGLVAPAIHDADRLDIDQMMAALRDLVNRARSWRLRSSEMSDPTITVTNLGERGVETAFPVIIPPQVAIVGFGRIMDSPVAVDGEVAIHPMVHASLAADHRVTDGHRGGLFLDALERLLQEPEAL